MIIEYPPVQESPFISELSLNKFIPYVNEVTRCYQRRVGKVD